VSEEGVSSFSSFIFVFVLFLPLSVCLIRFMSVTTHLRTLSTRSFAYRPFPLDQIKGERKTKGKKKKSSSTSPACYGPRLSHTTWYTVTSSLPCSRPNAGKSTRIHLESRVSLSSLLFLPRPPSSLLTPLTAPFPPLLPCLYVPLSPPTTPTAARGRGQEGEGDEVDASQHFMPAMKGVWERGRGRRSS
jgi:hypothetical protein